MSASPDIAAAREDVVRARGHIADTLAELESRIIAPVAAVRSRLDVGQLISNHPWPALGVALSTGVAIAISQADAKAATLAAEKAKQAGKKSVEIARRTPSRTGEVVRSARGGVWRYLDGMAAQLATSLIDSLRHSGTSSPRRPD
jgi:hypothetical protein